jgi:hypothetical protein
LAALGSLYLLWFKDDEILSEKPAIHHSLSGSVQHESNSIRQSSPSRASEVRGVAAVGSDSNALGIHSANANDMSLIPTITETGAEQRNASESPEHPGEHEPTAGRAVVRQWFTTAANYLGNAAHQKLDVSDYKDQQAHTFPEVPGETFRNPALERISMQYSQLREQNSRAESIYAPSVHSTSGPEGGSTPPLRTSPRPDTSPSRRPRRRDTLEVPTPVHIHRRTGSH